MKRTLFLFNILLFCYLTAFSQKPGSKEIIYAGTFTNKGSKGLYILNFDRAQGKLTEIATVAGGQSPNYLDLHPNGKYLYAVYNEGAIPAPNQEGSVMAYQINPQTGLLTKLNEQTTGGRGPAHIAVDPKGRFVYISNYGAGNLSVYPIKPDGSLGQLADLKQHEGFSINPNRQKEPHVHQAVPSADGKFIYVSDLGIDKIMIYAVDAKTGKLSPAPTPFAQTKPGSGPRHLVIHPNGNFAYSAAELNNTVAAYKVNKATGALTALESISMLPQDFTGTSSAADIHFSPDGKFLYASNRGHDSLVIYAVDAKTGKLTLVGFEPTRGKHPRNFFVDKKGDYLFVANRDDNNVVVFKRDLKTGKLTYSGVEAQIPTVVCVQQLFLK
ncbi:lactonase family protein [Adhaeribacter swui]|uniref:Lactonase family protein n=1 Tax=Adhaeribacter swui TaxID=2086471 RepID=A0A7G7G4U2_9BACT|nr:lactonase family protein [Adhaeribacter swui]QNF32176.1 lactonase family protein [Adhaeribacter swui]